MQPQTTGTSGPVDYSRRRFVRLASGLVVAGGATSLLAACGGGGTPAKPAEAPKAAEGAKPAPAAASPAATHQKVRREARVSTLIFLRPFSSPGARDRQIQGPRTQDRGSILRCVSAE